MIASKTIQGLR